ncbi:hypothetical protein LRY65_03380 [Candidatus Woesebacteria bacterium]|nr:hypothetical protein [Candidatus Woesebacteria bacterium]MCD8506936.1 hypothetical protein [Candidatus Woesebacteria bacterium]MCD8527226.1 hypothetical protein [Candidatus Woesebacteria bacterium]MCD8546592.1 hypothetical protein [Candidatus Woesebacteria bacterium]
MKRLSYAGILRQRLVVAGLTLGLIAVMIGVGIDIYLSNTRTTIPSTTRALTEPLNPQLDVETVLTLESYETVTTEGARTYVREILLRQQQEAAAEEAAVQESLGELGLVEATESAETTTPSSTPEESAENVSPFQETNQENETESETSTVTTEPNNPFLDGQ